MNAVTSQCHGCPRMVETRRAYRETNYHRGGLYRTQYYCDDCWESKIKRETKEQILPHGVKVAEIR